MYSPLIKALNSALDQLSKIKVPGLPDFNKDRQIVFARSDARCIESESYLKGSYKPDIVLVRWETLKKMQGKLQASFSHSYTSDICCKSGCDQPKLDWRNLLLTLEVKCGSKHGGANKWFLKNTYSSDFGDLSAEPTTADPPTFPPPALPHRAREIYPTRSRTSVSPSALVLPLIHFSSDPHVRKRRGVHTVNCWVENNGKKVPNDARKRRQPQKETQGR